jgi:hypothetical protein
MQSARIENMHKKRAVHAFVAGEFAHAFACG